MSKKQAISWKSREMSSPVMYDLVAPCLALDYKEADIVCFEIEDCAVATGDSVPGISRGDKPMGTITTKAGQGYIAMKTRVIEREDVQIYPAILAHKVHGDTALQDLKGGRNA